MDTDDLQDDLADYVPGLGEAENEPIPEYGPPPDEDVARMYLRRLARLENEEAKLKAIADAEHARINYWFSDRTGGIRRHAERLRQVLEGWQRATAVTTWTQPWGVGRLRPGRASVDVVDEAAFVEWAKANDRWDLLKLTPVKSSIKADKGPEVDDYEGDDRKAFRAMLADEIVPGVVITEPTRKGWTLSTN